MSDRLIDPFSPIESTDDADAAYSSMLAAANVNDADLAMKIARELIDSYWTRDEQRSGAALYTGIALMHVQRYDEARTWLQSATSGPADFAERAYEHLAELSRMQAVGTEQVSTMEGPARHLKVAREALERQDFATAAGEAVKVYEYDEASTYEKAAASLVAAEALYRQGNDAQAELYAEWALQHGEADQKGEAKELIAQWKAYRKADTSMDDGVTKKEVAAVLEQAITAELAQDYQRVANLLEELTSSGAVLTASQHDSVQVSLGEAYRHLRRYQEALTAYRVVRDDSSGFAKTQIDELTHMLELGDQL